MNNNKTTADISISKMLDYTMGSYVLISTGKIFDLPVILYLASIPLFLSLIFGIKTFLNRQQITTKVIKVVYIYFFTVVSLVYFLFLLKNQLG